ncbi:6-cysteine protein [Plasmodium knowlesi strain H]|uniref:6-cysteine protein n=3 Tax=Plasmodium knowlesi TaxID=5850 RepID=A0A5K1U0B9_PLAKH|nr:6-cysteine protein [Plasmodium knowlesi strain H]OTN65822.1 6-cysteine protein [Plasmodium knowlesi]CAA9987890.1 6-cysteine protein [Plasmodium knowlesi strain H]SBO22265.1 6-cysteine protein [Plasmodium knowlesi strain H]SBO28823.1 6-cysteine protein [Plasmodium knowlesi strain H]VVS77364.1 6-cysteine protein [Plasmodium knowlesi strain H]|eukprot:XP_002258888.1 hypothetical protein, conserved in Plasmodium species [Plasmodium knowlesi strain H]
MKLLTFSLSCLALLSEGFLSRAKRLLKFLPSLKEEGELFVESPYDCEHSGFISLMKRNPLYFCFFLGEGDNYGLLLRTYNSEDLKWEPPTNVLVTKQRISMYTFIDDYISEKLILIYSYDQKIRVTVFNDYKEPSNETYKIGVNYEIVHMANVTSTITYMFKNRKSIIVCGMNRNNNILCSFSFDYGLTMKDENSIEFILRTKIPMGTYKMDVQFNHKYVYFNLYDDVIQDNDYEIKCIQGIDKEYMCDILTKPLKETEIIQYRGVLRNNMFQTIVYDMKDKCYIGWSFNSINMNSEIEMLISDSPCSHVSLFHHGTSLVVAYQRGPPAPLGPQFYRIFENLHQKGAGCEFRVDGSLYVASTFTNQQCNIDMENTDVNPENEDEISFSIVVPSQYDIQDSTCFVSNEMYDNDKTTLYYLQKYQVDQENLSIFTFLFYRYIIDHTNVKESTCIFIHENRKEKLKVSLTLESSYRVDTCDIGSDDLCDFIIQGKSKIVIHFNEQDWEVDNQLLNESRVLYNGIHIPLHNLLSTSNINDLVQVTKNEISIFIPNIIPSSRTAKIVFTSRHEDGKTKSAYLRVQKNMKPIKKVLGINFSSSFDITYKYFKHYQENVKFLLNEFNETNYIGMVCETHIQITAPPCMLTLVDQSHKTFHIHSVFPHKVPFLYSYTKKKISYAENLYISETRFVVFKNFNSILEEKNIKYLYIKCVCNTKNIEGSDTYNQIDFIITTENISSEIIHSRKVIEPPKNYKDDSEVEEHGNSEQKESKGFHKFKQSHGLPEPSKRGFSSSKPYAKLSGLDDPFRKNNFYRSCATWWTLSLYALFIIFLP